MHLEAFLFFPLPFNFFQTLRSNEHVVTKTSEASRWCFSSCYVFKNDHIIVLFIYCVIKLLDATGRHFSWSENTYIHTQKEKGKKKSQDPPSAHPIGCNIYIVSLRLVRAGALKKKAGTHYSLWIQVGTWFLIHGLIYFIQVVRCRWLLST